MWRVIKDFPRGLRGPDWNKGWDFYNGEGKTEEKKAAFRSYMMRWTEEVLENDCAEITVTYTEPDFAGVRDVEVVVRGVNPCA